MPAPTTAPSNASSLARAWLERAVTPTVAAATAAMISGFLLSMSISCNSEIRTATAAPQRSSSRYIDHAPTDLRTSMALRLAVPLLPDFSAATEIVMAALELALTDLLLFRSPYPTAPFDRSRARRG